MTENQRPRIGVAAHICHHGQVLALERIAPHGKNTWTVPGGHLEHGEHWHACAIRELLEETGLTGHSPQLFAVTNDVFPATDGHPGPHYVTLHIALKTESPNFTNREPDKQTNLHWCAWHTMPEPRFPCIQAVYDQGLQPPYLG